MSRVIQFVLLAVALRNQHVVIRGLEIKAYNTNGIHPRASHPDLVARGGE